jgi:ABC-type glutathione transport system ATPase component
MNSVLSIKNLSVRLCGAGGGILREVALEVPQGAIVGIVGGSGSGKTTLGLAALGLLPAAMERVTGSVLVDGRDVTAASAEALRAWRGSVISMAFQEPASAFDPVMTIGTQIKETLLAHENVSHPVAQGRMLEALRSAGLKDAARVAAAYAFELSGGLRQRAMIAMAIVCRPKLLIADEPTSSLDSATQEKILDLFRELRRTLGLSIVLITHDLGVVRRVADDVIVMCKGEVVERGKVAQVLTAPCADYTRILMEADG